MWLRSAIGIYGHTANDRTVRIQHIQCKSKYVETFTCHIGWYLMIGYV